MATIRRTLTLWYTLALVGTMVTFGVALVILRRLPSTAELDARLNSEADLVAGSLQESYRVLGRVVTSDSSALVAAAVGPLEGVRDRMLLVDKGGRLLFTTEEARRLDYRSIEALVGLLRPLPTERRHGMITLAVGEGRMRYVTAPIEQTGGEVTGMVIATPTSAPTVEPAQLVQSMLLVAPLILLGGMAVGSLLAGRSLRPLQAIMDEVHAISDGRSLHRRVIAPPTGDELTRLATTLNGMLARLERSFTSLHRFTADASHELKTPLMVIRVDVERALMNPATPPEAIEALDQALEQISLMAEMVDNLLTLARADEGNANLAVERCDLRELVGEAAETAGILGEAPGISVRTELPEGPVVAAVDRSRIRQLLLNLVTNAIKYTPGGGKVSLALVDQGQTVALIVGDDGIGIAAADLPHIFDRFYRADIARTRTGDRPGTGLGLAITKWIAEAHGGTIGVQSRPGRGTVVTVTLPKEQPAAGPRVPGTGTL